MHERVGRALRAHGPNFPLRDLNELPNLTPEEQEILEQGPPSWRKAKMPGLTGDDQ